MKSKCDHVTIAVRRWPFCRVWYICVRCGCWFKEKPDK